MGTTPNYMLPYPELRDNMLRTVTGVKTASYQDDLTKLAEAYDPKLDPAIAQMKLNDNGAHDNAHEILVVKSNFQVGKYRGNVSGAVGSVCLPLYNFPAPPVFGFIQPVGHSSFTDQGQANAYCWQAVMSWYNTPTASPLFQFAFQGQFFDRVGNPLAVGAEISFDYMVIGPGVGKEVLHAVRSYAGD